MYEPSEHISSHCIFECLEFIVLRATIRICVTSMPFFSGCSFGSIQNSRKLYYGGVAGLGKNCGLFIMHDSSSRSIFVLSDCAFCVISVPVNITNTLYQFVLKNINFRSITVCSDVFLANRIFDRT